MERKRIAIFLFALFSIPTWVHAEINPVKVKKIQQDLYQAGDGSYIQTKNCFADADGDAAILKYEKYACDNNLRFNAKTTCEVVLVF